MDTCYWAINSLIILKHLRFKTKALDHCRLCQWNPWVVPSTSLPFPMHHSAGQAGLAAATQTRLLVLFSVISGDQLTEAPTSIETPSSQATFLETFKTSLSLEILVRFMWNFSLTLFPIESYKDNEYLLIIYVYIITSFYLCTASCDWVTWCGVAACTASPGTGPGFLSLWSSPRTIWYSFKKKTVL